MFELGVVLATRRLWEEFGIGTAIRRCIAEVRLTAPHEAALFAMAANRLEQLAAVLFHGSIVGATQRIEE
jgi:hypothetical protein